MPSGGKKVDESDAWFPQEVVEAHAVRGESLIKAWREHQGLTQADLAARAGMAQSSVARAEQRAARPRTTTLKKLAAAMNLSVAQLVD
jgi:predicted transcriptional regulator